LGSHSGRSDVLSRPTDQFGAAPNRDFRGVSPKSFDGRGNYTLGVREADFPEVEYDSIDQIRGMDISIITGNTDEEGAP